MLKRISIRGLGPHSDFTTELDPRGTTIIAGPSESGKSTFIDAVCLALWGKSSGGRFPVEAINDTAKKAEVELVLDSGRTIRRTLTRSKSATRAISWGSHTQTFTSEAKFAKALGELAEDPDAIRVVVVPQAWQPLVAGNARGFRDILTRILPEGDVGAVVTQLMEESGYELTPEEAKLSEKEVMKIRSAGRKEQNQALGRKESSQERVESLQASEPPVPDPINRAVLDVEGEWEAYDRVVGGAEARRIAEEQIREWDRRRAELGDEPPLNEKYRGCGERAKASKKEEKAAEKALQDVRARHQVALTRVEDFGGQDPFLQQDSAVKAWAVSGILHL